MSGLVPPDPPSHPAPSLRPRPSLPPRAAAASPPPTPPTPPHPAPPPPPPPPPTPPLRPASSPDPCFVRSADLGDGDGFLGRPRATFHRLDAVAVREEESRFKKAAAEGCNLLPLKRCIFSDHLTPVLAYRCLVREDDREAPSFLFESVEQGSEGTNVGRYSVIGAQPAMEIVAKANHVTVMDHEMKSRKEQFAPDPMTIPRSIMEQWNPQIADGLPDAFCGGWVGFFSYDTVHYVETKKLPFSKAPQDDRNLPDIHLGLYNDIVVFDHVEKKTHVVHWVRVDCYHSVDEAYEDGKNRLEALLSRLHSLNVTIVNRPLAGTIRREKTKAEDKVLEQLLLSDEKQCAEHIMLVDLGRNDVGKRGSNQAAETPTIVSDEDVLSVLMEQHDLFLSSTRSRLTKLQTVHQMWERNDIKGVIAAMDKMSDHAVSADMASVLMEKSETITLDLCTSLLPVLTDLLESKTDRHLGVSLELLVKFVRTFGPVIHSTVSVGPSSVGVDL